ncbi:hypothetical protein [uncultured Alistipes sp.]|uniref:hypothetical protein n=1 Tax=uncultured Alistipes sp. TaxID=538949 RepID=UPI00258D2C79|nr:hypothetical protein [uncultured Alistipes sp.]
MILPSMTCKEMYDHLAADMQKVEIKKEYLLPKAIKSFRKETRFPAWQLYEYKIPATNNQYIIYFYAESRARAEKPAVDSFFILFDQKKRYVIKWGASGYQHTPDSPMMAIREIHAYTSHFLQRYNERIFKDKSLTANESACRYLSRNTLAVPIQQNEEINLNHEKYGEYGQQAYRVRDGVCFTQSEVKGIMSEDGDRHKDKVDAVLILYTTFMNESKMTAAQRSAIFKEHVQTWMKTYEYYQKESKDGVIILTLER